MVLSSISNRSLLEKFIRWRLSISDPKHYTLSRAGPTLKAGNNLGPLFEMVTPDQASAPGREARTLWGGE